jgi:hypothetical protein
MTMATVEELRAPSATDLAPGPALVLDFSQIGLDDLPLRIVAAEAAAPDLAAEAAPEHPPTQEGGKP